MTVLEKDEEVDEDEEGEEDGEDKEEETVCLKEFLGEQFSPTRECSVSSG